MARTMTERTYHRVTIPLSDAEYTRYLNERHVTGAGTLPAAIRVALGHTESPYGYAKHRETHTPPLTHGEQLLVDKGITPGKHLADAVSNSLDELAKALTVAADAGELTLTQILTDQHAALRGAYLAYLEDTTQ
jgi:hypothetical protein